MAWVLGRATVGSEQWYTQQGFGVWSCNGYGYWKRSRDFIISELSILSASDSLMLME